jgi:hypothetical protein
LTQGGDSLLEAGPRVTATGAVELELLTILSDRAKVRIKREERKEKKVVKPVKYNNFRVFSLF